MENPRAWFVFGLYTLAIAFTVTWLIRKAFGIGKRKLPPCTLQQLSDKYQAEGRPDPFYVPDAWFNHIVNSIYTPPGSSLPNIPGQDDDGYFLLYNDSKLRPECTRPK